MADLPQNSTFGALTNAAYGLGKSLQKAQARPRVNVDQIKQTVGNITSAMRPEQLGTETTKYGESTKFEAFHQGLDLANTMGTPIPAFTGGTVTNVRTGMGNTPNTPSWGNFAIITDEQGNQWRYSHLQNNLVRVGQKIAAGTVLGTMGNSGGAYSTSGGTGSHLDLRIKDMWGKYVNPSSFF